MFVPAKVSVPAPVLTRAPVPLIWPEIINPVPAGGLPAGGSASTVSDPLRAKWAAIVCSPASIQMFAVLLRVSVPAASPVIVKGLLLLKYSDPTLCGVLPRPTVPPVE